MRGKSVDRRWFLAVLALVAVVGVGLERAGILDWRAGVALAQAHAQSWWLAPVLVLVTAGLYTAGMPGSLMVWVVGVVFPPAVAVPLFVAGGVGGALGAYSLARRAGKSTSQEEEDGRLLRLLARRSDFATLVALRVAPSFPHSAINIGAGLLRLPLGRFLAASALGLGIKGALYIGAIHHAARAATIEEAISWRILVPLAALALLLLLGPPLVRRLREGRDAAPDPIEPDADPPSARRR
ncbi:MAG: VTT domain-containing protein [Thermoanaerobaculia bacterium]